MEDLRCVRAIPVRVDGETVVQRCRGLIIPSSDGDSYECSDEGEEVRYERKVVEYYREDALWHRTSAISHMLALLTSLNPQAQNSSYPWIELPLGLQEMARAETTTGWWVVNLYREELPYQSWPTDFPTTTEDTEAVARSIAITLQEHTSPS